MFTNFKIDLNNAIADLKIITKRIDEEITDLLNIKSKTYNNFIRPYQEIVEKLSLFFTPISHINSVKNNEISKDIYSKSLPIITAFQTDLGQNTDIFNAFEIILKNEEISMSSSQTKLMEDAIKDFKNNGVHLKDKTKLKLKEINIHLSELSNTFFQNILDDTSKFEMIIDDKNDISGIPDNDLTPAKIDSNKYKFTLQMPSYIAYMTYGPNRQLREKIYKAYTTRAPKNGAIIQEILSLRDEKTKLLGYKSYADLSISTKTADSPEAVIDFLTDLSIKCKQYSNNELDQIMAIAKDDNLDEIKSFDLMYYSEKLKKHKLDIDLDQYRPYFEKNNVINGLFTFLNKLFNLEFKKIEIELWDESVTLYKVIRENTVIAQLYMDLDARDDKRDGAWMNNWHTRHITSQGELIKPDAFIVANFPPVSNNNPALLRHSDVVTLFHEMGHVLQHICSQIDEIFVSGINGVEWDVVEFPSQFLENFAYEKDVLKLFAKHYKTNETIPDNMIIKLQEIKNFNASLGFLRQIEFGLFDIKIHLNKHTESEVQSILDDVRQECTPILPPDYVKFQHQFAHIFSGGYAAGYYSYKWAERLSADAFFMFADKKVFDNNLANRFYDSILTKGGSHNPMDLFKDFAGRAVDNSALIKLYGIAD